MASGVNSSVSKVRDRVTTASPWAYVATASLAIAIFVADTVTPFEFSVSVLYVVVVLMAGRFLRQRGTALVAASCVALALTSALLTPPKGEAFLGVANTLISIAAISITSFLVLQSQAREVLQKKHIEELNRAEEKAAQQEKELRAVLDFSPQLIAVFSSDRGRLYANRPALDYIGLTLEQWQGITDPLWFFHPDDRERVAKGGYSGSGDDAPHEFEARFLRADGEYRWFLFRDNPLRDEQGKIERWYLTATDIDDRKQAETRLASTANELQRVMSSISDCLWSAEIDEHGNWNYGYYSPAIERITGRPASFFLRDPEAWFSIVHSDDKSRVATAAQRLAGGEVELAEGEYRILHANGDIRWIRDSGVATRSGKRLRIDGVVSDITERKRAEDELLRSEAYLAEAQRLTRTGSWAWVVKGESPNYWSEEMYRIWDFDPASGVPSPEVAWERIHPEDRERVREHMERALAFALAERGAADQRVVFADGVARDVHETFRSGQSTPVEVDTADFRIVLPNGTSKQIRFATRAVLNQSGELIEYVGTNVDITEEVRAERELRDSESRFRTLVDYAADAILLRGDDGTLIDVNQYACELLGYSREELIEMTPRDLVDPNEDPAFFRSVDERLRAGELFGFESGLRRKDGIVLPVEVRVRPFSQGGRQLFLAIARDITERKHAEDALRASEARFRTFADHAADAYFVHDEHGTIIDANREACTSLGYTREELIGLHPLDLDRGQATPPTPLTKARLEAGETVTFESVVCRKDGSLFPVEWRIRPYQQGSDRFALSSARDITDRKRAEAERERLRELEAELAHINRINVIGEMTASIAHEINQPLSGVVSNGEACLLWLAADSPNLEEAREAARRIVRDGTRAGEIITRIRHLARKAAAPKARLDLNESVSEVLALVADEARKNKVRIHAEFAENLSPVLGDRVQLQQVVLNIVMNALDAMTQSDSKRLIIRTWNELDQVNVTVQDTGNGLNPSTIERMFDPFFSTKPGGMGMGLSISRSIVLSHGGRIWATASDGAGATIQFTLPQYHEG
jgi:PAS domain S-box-containing protein